MKADIAYYLILLYVTVMFKPLIPIISDAWSHEFNEVAHVSTVHAKYGSNHLQKDLANENNKNQNALRTADEVPFHFLSNEFKFISNEKLIDKKFLPSKFQKIREVFISKHIPPPKFS